MDIYTTSHHTPIYGSVVYGSVVWFGMEWNGMEWMEGKICVFPGNINIDQPSVNKVNITFLARRFFGVFSSVHVVGTLLLQIGKPG